MKKSELQKKFGLRLTLWAVIIRLSLSPVQPRQIHNIFSLKFFKECSELDLLLLAWAALVFVPLRWGLFQRLDYFVGAGKWFNLSQCFFCGCSIQKIIYFTNYNFKPQPTSRIIAPKTKLLSGPVIQVHYLITLVFIFSLYLIYTKTNFKEVCYASFRRRYCWVHKIDHCFWLHRWYCGIFGPLYRNNRWIPWLDYHGDLRIFPLLFAWRFQSSSSSSDRSEEFPGNPRMVHPLFPCGHLRFLLSSNLVFDKAFNLLN